MKVLWDVSLRRFAVGGTVAYCDNLIPALQRCLGQKGELLETDVSTFLPGFSRLPRKLRVLGWYYPWLWKGLDREIHRMGANLLHVPSTVAPVSVSCAKVVTVHDIFPLRMPHAASLFHSNAMRRRLPAVLNSADAIVAVSEHTRQDLLDLCPMLDPNVVHVVHEALPASRVAQGLPGNGEVVALRRRLQLPENFILGVATLQPRKNLRRLCEAFLSIKDVIPHDLVLVGASGFKAADSILPAGTEARARIHTPGYVSDQDLNFLYSEADLFAYPSLYEGFGLPVLEAMAADCPVLTSDTTSLPEVSGGAAFLVNPSSVEDIAEGLLRLAQDASLRASLQARGRKRVQDFSWEKAASETRRVYDAALEHFHA